MRWWPVRSRDRSTTERARIEAERHAESMGHARRQGRVAVASLVVAVVSVVVAIAIGSGGSSEVRPSARGPAVRVLVETDPTVVFAGQPEWQSYSFVTPIPPSRLSEQPPEACRAWRSWARRYDAVDADQTNAYATLQGRPDTAVQIDGVEVEMLRRAPAMRGTSGHCLAPGGAVGNPRLIDVDLDADPPDVLYAELGDDFPQRRRLVFTLTGPETETLQLRAHTRRCDCTWRVRIHMVVDGRRQDVVVDDRGHPFRTSASGAAVHRQWSGVRWAPLSRAAWRRTLPVDWRAVAKQIGG